VIARRGGGALETVIDGVTGRFWSGGAAELAQAVLEFDDAAVDPATCVRNAARFDVATFREGIREQIAAASTAMLRPHGERQPLMATRLVRRAISGAPR
jgi:glycosyltransferase involved in cell wall biosynthesis